MSGAFVQSHFTSLAVTNAYSSNTTSGNTLILMTVVSTPPTDITSVTDSQSNTWVQAGTGFTIASGGIELQTWYCLNCAGGANTVTIHGPTSGFVSSFWVTEFSGVTGFDATYGNDPGICLGNPSVTFTPAQANEVAITQCWVTFETFNSQPTGYTLLVGGNSTEAAYDANLASGSQVATWNTSSSCPCGTGFEAAMQLTVFKTHAVVNTSHNSMMMGVGS